MEKLLWKNNVEIQREWNALNSDNTKQSPTWLVLLLRDALVEIQLLLGILQKRNQLEYGVEKKRQIVVERTNKEGPVETAPLSTVDFRSSSSSASSRSNAANWSSHFFSCSGVGF